MWSPSRRALLVAAGSGVAASLAGCSADPDAGLHAVNAVVIREARGEDADYPADVTVRVTVENTSADRMTSRLVTDLERDDGETWTRERDVDLSGGTSIGYRVRFSGVHESPSDEFEASAAVADSGE